MCKNQASHLQYGPQTDILNKEKAKIWKLWIH